MEQHRNERRSGLAAKNKEYGQRIDRSEMNLKHAAEYMESVHKEEEAAAERKRRKLEAEHFAKTAMQEHRPHVSMAKKQQLDNVINEEIRKKELTLLRKEKGKHKAAQVKKQDYMREVRKLHKSPLPKEMVEKYKV